MNARLQPVPRLLNVDEYHRMADAGIFGPEERVELIEGEIITMAPIGPDHGSAVARLTHLLVPPVDGQAIVWGQNSVILSNRSEPVPDLCLLAPRADFYATALPRPADTLLSIEVAKTSLRYDTDRKAPLYAREGIPELWIVDVAGRIVVRFRSPGPQGYADVAPLDLARPVTLPTLGIDVTLASLFG